MGKTDYILIDNPNIVHITANNPMDAEQQYRAKYPGTYDLLIVPRKAATLNKKKIKPITY